MSYILDAIRKAEQERQKQQAPELLRVAPGPAAAPARSRPWLPLLLVAGAVTLVANIAYWQLRATPETSESSNQSATAQSPTEIETAAAKPAVSKPATTSNSQAVNASPATAPGTIASERIAPTTVATQENTAASQLPAAGVTSVPLWQAPAQAKAAISALEFSFHVYSDNPARRTIIINRKRMKEGQQISSDLRLQAINEQGVVIAFQDLLVEVSVLEQW